MTKLESTIYGLFAFLICCGISILGLYIALRSLLASGGFFSGVFGGGRPATSLEILGFLVGIFLPFILFPFGAWLARDIFKVLDPSFLPFPILSIFFGLFPVFAVLLFLLYFSARDKYTTWHPFNGQQIIYDQKCTISEIKNWKNGTRDGLNLTLCSDGTIKSLVTFENDKPIGDHVIFPDCQKTDSFSYTLWKPAGVEAESVTFLNGLPTVVHTNNDGVEISTWYRFDEKTGVNRISEQTRTVGATNERFARSFNPDGAIRRETKYIGINIIEDKVYK